MSCIQITRASIPEHWITPEEQLKRCSHAVAKKISKISGLLLSCAELVVNFASVNDPATSSLRAWSKLGVHLEVIPPLPEFLYDLIDEDCPLLDREKIGATHLPVLVPQEFCSIDFLFDTLLAKYMSDKKMLPSEKATLSFGYFSCKGKYSKAPFKRSHWILISLPFYPAFFEGTWQQNLENVAALKKKSHADYKIPELQQIIAAALTMKIAGLPHDVKLCRWMGGFTMVQETGEPSDEHLCFSSFFTLHWRQPPQMFIETREFERIAVFERVVEYIPVPVQAHPKRRH